MTIRGILAVTALTISSPALADWQYTKWNMSAQEVADASKGSVKTVYPRADSNLMVEAEGTHRLGSVDVPTQFLFEKGLLQQVTLRLTGDGLCWAIGQRLRSEYGTPFSDVPSPVVATTKWKDTNQGNTIELLGMGDICYITYSPIDRRSGSGL